MMRHARDVLRASCAVFVGVEMALVCAGSTAQPTKAGAQVPDSPQPPSPFVARARRGEVAVPTPDEIEHMCALLTACDRLPIPSALFPANFQSCVMRMTDEMMSPGAVNFSLTMRECGLRADSCASLRACALHGVGPEACKGRGKQGVVGFCDVEGRALRCWHDEVLAVRDCIRGGEQCVVVDGEPACTLGTCPAAVREGDKPTCSGSGRHLLRCDRGKLASLDCAAFGLRCTTTGDGISGCATSGPECRGAEKRCEGNVAVGCVNGHEVRVDCNAGGLACAESPGTMQFGACLVPPALAGACDPTEKAKCDGTSIHYCFAGRVRSYSCNAVGFRKCETGKNGVRCSL